MLVRLVIGLKVKDLDCGFKLIRRSALAQVQPLQARGAVISAELLTKLRRAGHPLAEVGVNHYTRVGGQPTGANLRVIARALGELFRLRRQLRAYAPRPR